VLPSGGADMVFDLRHEMSRCAPKDVFRTRPRVSGNGIQHRQRWRGSDSSEKCSRIKDEGSGWDMEGSESSKPPMNHIRSVGAKAVNLERLPWPTEHLSLTFAYKCYTSRRRSKSFRCLAAKAVEPTLGFSATGLVARHLRCFESHYSSSQVCAGICLVPRHRGFDWLIFGSF
jgi:hypothetical protein